MLALAAILLNAISAGFPARCHLAPLCTCRPIPPVSGALQQADAVFLGRADTLHDQLQFRIAKYWKGAKVDTVVVIHNGAPTTCAYPFEVGRSYLVYARLVPAETGAVLLTTICTRTAPAEAAGDDMRLLADLSPRATRPPN
jgi:hypothetical protein